MPLSAILQPILNAALGMGVGVTRIALGRNNLLGPVTGSASVTDTGGTSTKLYKPKGDVTSLKLIVGNVRVSVGGSGAVEIDGYNAIPTVKAAVEYPLAGTLYPMLKAGVSSFALAASGGPVELDALTLSVADQANLRVRYYVAVPSPDRYVFNGRIGSNQESSNHLSQFGDGSDKTGVTGNFTITGPNGVFSCQPMILVGVVQNGKALMGLGDSIFLGRGFTPNTQRQETLSNPFDGGIVDGSMNSINASIAGATIGILVGATADVDAKARLMAARYVTGIICQLGINDLASITGQQLATKHLTLAARLGKPYYVTTLTPYVTTTDGCITIANQTKSARETERVWYNNWGRAGSQVDGSGVPVLSGGTPSPLIAGFVDYAAAVEADASNVLTVNGGYWKVPAAPSSGPHTLTGSPTTTSFPVGAAPFSAGLETGRVIKMLTGARAGQTAVIVNSTTSSLTLYANGSTTQSGIALVGLSGAPAAGDTFEIYDVKTNEGLHAAVAGQTDTAAVTTTWRAANSY